MANGEDQIPPQHPGTVTLVEVFDKTERVIPVEQFPEAKRFVYLKDGAESDPSQADECVPVVRVDMISLNDKGDIVHKSVATRISIRELGPEGRPLRLTMMVKK